MSKNKATAVIKDGQIESYDSGAPEWPSETKVDTMAEFLDSPVGNSPIHNGLINADTQSCRNKNGLFVREANGNWQDWINVTDLQQQNKAMKDALVKIAKWEDHDVSLTWSRGTNGVREYYRDIAKKLLSEVGDE